MPQRVLIVDENDDDRTFVYDTLTSSGFQAVSASTAAEAHDFLAQNPPDIVVVDLLLPMVDGLTLINTISTQGDPKTPILYYTGRGEHVSAGGVPSEFFTNLGDLIVESEGPSTDLLLEPLDSSKLLDAVKNLLATAEAREASADKVPYARRIGIDVGGSSELIDAIRGGIPYEAFEKLREELDITAGELADIVQIPKRTLARRKKSGSFRPDESDRILRISRIYDLALQLFEEDQHATRSWIRKERASLGGASPLTHSMTEIGSLEVEELIRGLEHGVFA